MPAADVVDYLACHAEPGLMAMPSGRFFGWVIGGTLPAAMAADWLVSSWDQNSAIRYATPAIAAIEEAAGDWLLQLLGLPEESDVGFVTGATMANFTGHGRCALAAADGRRLGRWTATDFRRAAHPLHCRRGTARHDRPRAALPGAGQPHRGSRRQPGTHRRCGAGLCPGPHRPGPLCPGSGPTEGSGPAPILVCLQAGNVHSGAFDPFAAAIAVSKAHGAWVHVDGAFGLWAAAVPELAGLTAGVEGADSWATDAHKSLNVPYDCGIAVVRDPQALRSAMGQHASYLLQDADGSGDPSHKVPELSRRARGVPVWAALKSLGRDGVAEQVRRLATSAARLAEKLAAIDGVEVLNDVGFTQITLAFGDDATTRGRGGENHWRTERCGCPDPAGTAGTCCGSR